MRGSGKAGRHDPDDAARANDMNRKSRRGRVATERCYLLDSVMIKIGAKDWVRELKARTAPLGTEFWSGFTPATATDVRQVETRLQRKLDSEFCEFYRTIGYGNFRNKRGYGGI